MKNKTFTPGPWHVEPKVSDNGASLVICDGGKEGILAVIPPINDADEPSYDTAKRGPHDVANAALLAAAPELLAAMEEARTALTFYREWMAEHGAPEANGTTAYPFGISCENTARAIIAKAKGQAK